MLTKLKASEKFCHEFDNYTFLQKFIASDQNIKAVGIDLGTSRCCVAVNRRSGIETVSLDGAGQRLLPSYVAFDDEHSKCGKIAVDRLRNHAKSTVFDAKRIIGKFHTEVKPDNNWTFAVLPFKTKSWYPYDSNIPYDAPTEVLLQVYGKCGEQLKYPEEISAELLKHIKTKVDEFQGKNMSEAVITVPAAFSDSQKFATRVAALLAGWENVYLLPEPVAAAFAYFIDLTIPNNSTFLLFDLGGGTLDVCVFGVKNDKLFITSRSGEPNIGGRDFDNVLIDYFEKKLFSDFKIKVNENKKYKLMLKCQEIKHQLSLTEEDQLDVEDFDLLKEDVYIAINRQQFEEMSKDLLEKIKYELLFATNKSKLTSHQIDRVLQVGGGCRMPMIKKLLRDTFPMSEHLCVEHPDEIVAVGAAYYACYLNTVTTNENRCSIMKTNIQVCSF